MAAIIKVGLAAANESGGQKGNTTSYIGGQLPGAEVSCQVPRSDKAV